MTILIIILLLIFVIAYFTIRERIRRTKQYNDFLKIFGDWKMSIPKIEFGATYGWPTFQITFQKKEDLEFARRNRLIDDFKEDIKSYYGKRFDVDAAVKFTYEGE